MLTPRGRDELRDLWRYVCEKLTTFPPSQLDVYGFNKLQLVLLDPKKAGVSTAVRIPLDVEIELAFKKAPFDAMVIAFDAEPANQAITTVKGNPCLRLEKDFVLDRLSQSTRIAEPFRTAADSLLKHYAANRKQPRASARPPIGDVEIIYMDPAFEALPLQDEGALRRVFSLTRIPASWPRLGSNTRPDFVLRKIVNEHHRHGPTHLRVSYDAAKHAWAKEVLRNASSSSRIWNHEIAARFRKVMV